MISEIIHKVEPEYPTVKDSWKKEIPDMLFVVLDFNKCKTQKLCTEEKKKPVLSYVLKHSSPVLLY